MVDVRQVLRALVTPVTMLALLAVVGYGGYWGFKQVTADTSRPEATCVPTDVGDTLTPEYVSVRVLNGGETGGQAARTRSFLIAYEFRVLTYGNADIPVEVTTIVGNAADDPEVRLVQMMFDGAVTKGDGRADHVVDVILGTTDQKLTNPTKPSIAVSGPVCLPTAAAAASASPTADAGESPEPTPSASPAKKSKKK